MTSNDILLHLSHGRFDDVIEDVFGIARERIRVLAGRRAQIMQVGDRVALSDRINPKTLAGAVGVVTKIKTSQVWIRLDHAHGRDYPAKCVIEVPTTSVQFL